MDFRVIKYIKMLNLCEWILDILILQFLGYTKSNYCACGGLVCSTYTLCIA
jgi:hypothetical protein